jgi:diacylglycerol kinase (ATP)
MKHDNLKLLFIINPFAGNNKTDWALEIESFFANTNQKFELYHCAKTCNSTTLKERIKLFLPDWVIAVLGDGTVKMVAESILQTKIRLGILPAGSANGLAKELGISIIPSQALEELINGYPKKIHLTKINEQLCIHLSDIGLNAFALKKFKNQGFRGMWGYLFATLKVVWQNPIMEIKMQIKGEIISIKAEMVIIANATKYGTGLIINPIGTLSDELFEVIVVKNISPFEIFKINFTQANYDSEKIELYQTNILSLTSSKKVHFQIDGEYLGKISELKANLLPNAIEIIVPNV